MQPQHIPHRKHRVRLFLHCCVRTLLNHSSGVVACLRSCCLAIAVSLVRYYSCQASCHNALLVCWFIDFLSTVDTYVCCYRCTYSFLCNVYICMLSVTYKRYFYILCVLFVCIHVYCLCYVVLLYLRVLRWLVYVQLSIGLVFLLCCPCGEILNVLCGWSMCCWLIWIRIRFQICAIHM
jgi:hypothetical protein